MDAIANYIRLAEAHSVQLQFEERYLRLAADNEVHELAYQEHAKARRSLGHELQKASPLAIQLLIEKGIDATPLAKCTLAAKHYLERFQDEWFSCHAFLMIQQTQKPADPVSDPDELLILRAIQIWNNGDKSTSWPQVGRDCGKSEDELKAFEESVRRYAKAKGIRLRQGKRGAKSKSK